MSYSNVVKSKLKSVIKQMSQEKELYVRNPQSDFTRNRKISFDTVINVLLSMGGNSLGKELLEFYSYHVNAPTPSAFVQQRAKVLPEALEHPFYEFTNSIDNFKTYEGYRLLAMDGTDIRIPYNAEDSSTFCQISPTSRGFNLLHLNTIYDLQNKVYLDAIIQPKCELNERQALVAMVGRSTLEKVLCLIDRGLESYNCLTHMDRKGWKYLARVKDLQSNGILKGLILPSAEEFDVQLKFILSKRYTTEVKAHPEIYKYIHPKTNFSFFEQDNCNFYPFSFRVVRGKIADRYFSFITNLSPAEFPTTKIKSLYLLRWGIETAFRELKYALGLVAFHAKKADFIIQEIFARLTMYNFCETITLHVTIKQQINYKHSYQVNFTQAIHICKKFFSLDENPPDVEGLIKKFILPVRPERSYPRRDRRKSFISHIYRIA